MERNHEQPMTRFFTDEEHQRYRDRWTFLQAGFIDDPRGALERAIELVGEMTTGVADTLDREQSALESHWKANGDASTETLRMSLQQYRDYVEQLLALDAHRGRGAPLRGR